MKAPRMYETIIFLQGDDYSEAEHALYPGSTTEELHRGFLKGGPDVKALFMYLVQWDYGDPTGDKGTETPWGAGDDGPYYFTDAGRRSTLEPRNGYAVTYHTGLSYAALTRITTREE